MSSHNRKVLVTGGNGFVGSHLVESLVKEGKEVICLVRPTSDLCWLKGLPIDLHYGCVLKKRSLIEAVKGVHFVYHLAGITKAMDYEGYEKVNYRGTKNLLEACAEANPGVEKVVIMSSLAASGPAEGGRPKREEDPCKPISYYGKSKRMGELIALEYSKVLPIVILRPSAIYGPRDRDIYPFFKMFQFGINGLAGKKERYVSLCHIEDVVTGIQRAVTTDQSTGEIFFLSDGESHPWSRVTSILKEVIGARTIDLRIPDWAIDFASWMAEGFYKASGKPPLFNRQKALEMRQSHWTCDISKARKYLNYKPSVELIVGFRQTFFWYRDNGWL